MMPRAPSQLPLPLPHPPQYGRESFVEGPSNAAALAFVESWPAWSAPVAVLSGPAGSGKTHLAHIWAERGGVPIRAADALAAGESLPLPLGGGLVIEDVAREDVPERELFHLINTVAEGRAHLLLTSREPSAQWRLTLPDLRSRLRLAIPAALEPADETLLRQVLVKLFSDRQLEVDRPVIDYLLLRMERSVGAAAALVEELDRRALASARRITRATAAELLAETIAAHGEFTEGE